MTVFGHSGGGGGGFLAGKQVFPVDYEAEVSQRLLEASHSNDLKSASECIVDPFVDVNFVGAVCLKVKKAEVFSRDESPNEVRFEYEEFKADVTALFLAAHAGNVALVKKLLVNKIAQPLFSYLLILSIRSLFFKKHANSVLHFNCLIKRFVFVLTIHNCFIIYVFLYEFFHPHFVDFHLDVTISLRWHFTVDS